MYEFSKIPNWAFDDNSFTFIVMDNGITTKILLETTVVSVILSLFTRSTVSLPGWC